MKRVIAVLLISLPLPAAAEDCSHWTAGMQEDEGGSVMTAWICAPAGKGTSYFSVMCGEAGKLSARWSSTDPAGFQPSDPEFTTTLQFSLDETKFDRPAHYEEMDGAMVVDIDIGSDFLTAFQSSAKLSIADRNAKVDGAGFTLKSSKAALGKLISTCPKI